MGSATHIRNHWLQWKIISSTKIYGDLWNKKENAILQRKKERTKDLMKENDERKKETNYRQGKKKDIEELC